MLWHYVKLLNQRMAYHREFYIHSLNDANEAYTERKMLSCQALLSGAVVQTA